MSETSDDRRERRRASRSRAIDAAAVAPKPPQRPDPARSEIREVVGLGFRVHQGRLIFPRLFASREDAEEYLNSLENVDVGK